MTAIIVGELHETDRARWGELWRLYLEFYRTTLPDSAYNLLWQRIRSGRGPVWGLGARFAGNGMPLVGITHFLFHDHGWSAKPVCYLQDLYVDAAARGQGAGRALIERDAAAARERDCLRLYWTTKEDNATARRLYDGIARFNGFIRYDYALE